MKTACHCLRGILQWQDALSSSKTTTKKHASLALVQDAWGNAVGALQPDWNFTVSGRLMPPGLAKGNVTVLQQQDAAGEQYSTQPDT